MQPLRTRLLHSGFSLCLGFAGFLALTAPTPARANDASPIGPLTLAGPSIQWTPTVSYESLILVVSGPTGEIYRQEFRAGATPAFSLYGAEGSTLADGIYSYELRTQPAISPGLRAKMEEIRTAADGEARVALRQTQELPETGLMQSGAFSIRAGDFVDPTQVEARPQQPVSLATARNAGGSAAAPSLSTKDVLFIDDLIVSGSACVGFSCLNGESFGSDTLRLKETTLRLKFQDTSGGSFPSRDWQLTANDSPSGGANKFSIDDIDGGLTPFTLMAGAPSHSLFVASSGRVGLGTSAPGVEAHVVSGDSPALRLEQDGSSSFTPQIWDIAGNEANFFVRDNTAGALYPFRIRPGAPTDALTIDAEGDVGIGTFAPSESLHIRGTDGGTKFLVTEGSSTTATRQLFELINNGPVRFDLTNTADDNWRFTNLPAGLQIIRGGTGVTEFLIEDDGDVVIAGTLTENSDRNTKHQIFPVAPREVLSKVQQLPVSTWVRKTDGSGALHMGPMAQDFASAFGLGDSETKISTIDVGGVSLAAIQGLTAVVDENAIEVAAEVQTLKTQNSALMERVAALERLVEQLIADR